MNPKIKLKRAGVLTKIVVAVLLVYMVITLQNMRTKISDAQAQLEEYQQQIDQQEQINAQLQSDVENGTAEDELEDIARYKLGLVEPGEKVFYDITN